jgi:hypothetical protein
MCVFVTHPLGVFLKIVVFQNPSIEKARATIHRFSKLWFFKIHRSKKPGRPSIVFQNCGFSKSIDRQKPIDRSLDPKIVVFQNRSIEKQVSSDSHFFSEPTKNCGSIHHPPSIDHPSITHNHKKPLFSKHIHKHQQLKIQSFSETLPITVGTAHCAAKKVGIESVPLRYRGFTGFRSCSERLYSMRSYVVILASHSSVIRAVLSFILVDVLVLSCVLITA